MTATHIAPADRPRQIELVPQLIGHVVALKDNPAYPLHKDRIVRYMVDRWKSAECFAVLDELCGIHGIGSSMFPEIPSIKLFGDDFRDDDVLHVEIEWLGTDGVQVVIAYHKEAHARMVLEREAAIAEAREKRALLYPTLQSVLSAYKALRRSAWTPVFDDGASDKGTRYYGLPWMPADTEWPTNEDGRPLTFIMQIDIASLPGSMRDRVGDAGLIAMFYDMEADWNPDYEGLEAYETDARLIRYDTSLEGALRDGPGTDRPIQRVVSWRAVGDYPSMLDVVEGTEVSVSIQKFLLENALSIGGGSYRRHVQGAVPDAVSVFVKQAEAIWGADACDFETAGEAVDLFCGDGDKLGGWPSWDAGRRWPLFDGRRLEHFIQLDLMDPHWGDFAFWRGDERAHVFFDPQDTSVFRLTWDRGNEET